jgi:Zn-dependent M28 family amino/carboxypeptidase
VHDLRLVLFGGEEQGLFGSRRHVHDLSAVDRGRIKAVINMDMIAGRNTPAPAVLIEGAAVSQAVIDALASAAGTYTALEVETSLFPFNSDHVPFIDAGLPAVLTIEGADGANDTIHGPGDVFASIDFDLALEILRMNVAALALTLARLE